jgi:tetratricopeptide (TPR) repeat protein
MSGLDDELARVRALLDVGRWQQAQQVLAPVIAQAPESGNAACLMAQSHLLGQNWTAMLAEADRGCALQPDREWAHRLRSIALRNMGRTPDAVAAAQEAVRLRSDIWQPRVVLAEALLAGGDQASAHAALSVVQDALAFAPEQSEVQVTAGRVRAALGERDAARGHYLAVLAAEPNHAVARNNLAVLDVRRGRATAAANQFASVLAADPMNPLFMRNSQAAATTWVGNVMMAGATLYLAAMFVGALPQPEWLRLALAGLVAVGSVTTLGYAYRRLSPVVRRMALWPRRSLVDGHRGPSTLQLNHVRVSLIIVGQALSAWAAIGTADAAGAFAFAPTLVVLPTHLIARVRLRRRSR